MATQKIALEQQRAADALMRVKSLKGAGPLLEGMFRSYVKGLPAEIMTEGLGQALATHLAASGSSNSPDAHRALYSAVSDWLCRNDPYAPYPGQANAIEGITHNDAAAYRQAHMEAMSYLVWLKKFAVALLTELPSKSPEASL